MTYHTAHFHLSDPDPLRRSLDYWVDDHSEDSPDVCPICGGYQHLWADTPCDCQSSLEECDDAGNA